jgi:hypothetical protein
MPELDRRTPSQRVPVITPVPPPAGWERASEGRRIVVMLAGNPKVDPDDPGTIPERDAWSRIERTFGVAVASPFEGQVRLSQLNGLDENAFNPPPGEPPRRPLSSIIEVRLGAGVSPDLPALLGAVRRIPGVDEAFLASRRGRPPGTGGGAASLQGDQFYLGTAGVNASAVAAKGAAVTIIDIERGWGTPHPDLPAVALLDDSSEQIKAWKAHGTGVLGLLGALDNGRGIRGVAPDATLKGAVSRTFAGQLPPIGCPRIEVAITKALLPENSIWGDIILIEEQTNGLLPVEVQANNRTAILSAVGNGRVVVEAAGNGGLSLDDETWDNAFVFPPRVPPPDSGAIMVGAAWGVPPQAMPGSNHGARLDCFAPGWNIVTTKPPDSYTTDFGGTSAAAAIIAGAAAVVQGLARAVGGGPLTSRQMRRLLTNPDHCSARIDLPRRIGCLPDLELIAADPNAWADARANP